MVLFSIVVPLYNKEHYIIRAIDSIAKQSYKKYEVIIIDDGSTDSSGRKVEYWISHQDVLMRNKFRLISQENRGVSITRNRGVLEAKNNYIALLDADDYWESTHLENLKELVDKYNNETDIFSCAIKQLESNGEVSYPKLGIFENFSGIIDFFSASLISSGFVNSSSVCVKKECFLLFPFPIDMKNHEDIVTWARIANKKGVAFCSDRSVIQSIDAAEASLSIDFENYIKFKEIILGISYDMKKLKKYTNKYIFLSILFSKTQMDYNLYAKKMINILKKDMMLSVYLIVVFVLPKWFVNLFRNYRKK